MLYETILPPHQFVPILPAGDQLRSMWRGLRDKVRAPAIGKEKNYCLSAYNWVITKKRIYFSVVQVGCFVVFQFPAHVAKVIVQSFPFFRTHFVMHFLDYCKSFHEQCVSLSVPKMVDSELFQKIGRASCRERV